jgi:hypothetical protein
MKALAKFTAGSSAFFDCYPDFNPGDIDILIIMDDLPEGDNVFHLFDGKKDNLLLRKMTKEGYIRDALDSGVPMRLGKFLVPEFASFIKMDIQDLKRLEPLTRELDEKHTYEKIIYDAYIQNDGWWLTEDQRMAAYSEYRRTRNYI